MRKDLQYYMKLNYPVEIQEIPEEEGGGYAASIPQLGKYAFRGDGDTIEEAIRDLEEIKKALFEDYLEKKIPISEPEPEEEKDYSGKFVLRLPKELHRYLSLEAKRNSTTLNQYCLYLLTRKSYLKSIQEELKSVSTEIKTVFSHIKEIDYKIDHPKQSVEWSQANKLRVYDYKKSA